MFKFSTIKSIKKIYLFPLFTLIFFPYSSGLRAIDKDQVDINKTNFINKNYLKKSPSEDYLIGEGDTIQIIISRDTPEINGTYKVDNGGTIYMPRIHRTFISGLTLNELNNALDETFSEFVKNPKTESSIIVYRPIKVYVEGEVEQPGLYVFGSDKIGEKFSTNFLKYRNKSANNIPTSEIPLEKPETFPTIYDAIQRSQGITMYSDLENIEITRVNSLSKGGGRKKTNLNFLKALGGNGVPSLNIRIYDGDIIKINRTNNPISTQISKAINTNLNPQFMSIFVSGRVNSPGLLAVSKASTLEDGLDIAGGTNFLKGKIRFIRANQDGTIEKRKFSFKRNRKRGSYKNPYLKNGDIIYVDKSIFNVANEVLKEITSPFLGIYSTYKIFD